MSKTIPLTRGKFAIVDDEDYDCLSRTKWYCSRSGYAIKNVWMGDKYEKLWMHLFIMPHPEGMETDHINRNKLDNRRSNLRVCTPSQNQSNKGVQSNNRSGIRGVSWNSRLSKWVVHVCKQGKVLHLGVFSNLGDAAVVYDKKASELYGEFYSPLDGIV